MVTAHFRETLDTSGVNLDNIDVQWESVKSVVYSTLSPEQIKELNLLKFHRLFQNYPDILSLFDLLATIPASSSEAERGFSQMNLMKSEIRTKLTDDHLNQLMRIKLEAPEVGLYDPTAAIQKWNGAANRRPSFTQGKKRRERVIPAAMHFDEDARTPTDITVYENVDDLLEQEVDIQDQQPDQNFVETEDDIPEGASDIEIESDAE